MSEPTTTPALERALDLLDPAPTAPDLGRGYLDLLGEAAPQPTGLGQRLMLTRAVPTVYERWWRPALGQAAKGPFGPRMAEEHRIARELLGLTGDEVVLDVACGPGNFTRELGSAIDDGVVLGIDASATMLGRAVAEPTAPNVGYVRGDAVELPFRDRAFDAVCCFAALHLFADPFRALDHMTRVLRPGGRIAILTSFRAGGSVRGPVETVLGAATGMAMFGRDEMTGALAARGFLEVRRRVAGFTQFVGARKR